MILSQGSCSTSIYVVREPDKDTIGIVDGIGLGYLFTPSVSILLHYFQKRRGIFDTDGRVAEWVWTQLEHFD